MSNDKWPALRRISYCIIIPSSIDTCTPGHGAWYHISTGGRDMWDAERYVFGLASKQAGRGRATMYVLSAGSADSSFSPTNSAAALQRLHCLVIQLPTLQVHMCRKCSYATVESANDRPPSPRVMATGVPAEWERHQDQLHRQVDSRQWWNKRSGGRL